MNKKILIIVIFLVLTWPLIIIKAPLIILWPIILSLLTIFITRNAIFGLLIGAFTGAVILNHGNPWDAYVSLFKNHLASSLSGEWKVGALAFTAILGGFAALLEKSGGWDSLLNFLFKKKRSPRKGQFAIIALGMICFFDGLASCLIIGRVGKSISDKSGISREKLALFADSTSSAIACIALISTWTAYLLGIIGDTYSTIGRDINPYLIFLKSIPYNFYCLFIIIFMIISAWKNFNFQPLKKYEDNITFIPEVVDNSHSQVGAKVIIIPLLSLFLSLLLFFYILSVDSFFPITVDKLISSLGSSKGPLVMTLASIVGSVTALVLFPKKNTRNYFEGINIFINGLKSMIAPLMILISAWVFGSVIQALHVDQLIVELLAHTSSVAYIPFAIFIVGALLSFATGTSWGAMGILFPLVISAVAKLTAGMPVDDQDYTLITSIAAVFSGAVFGDHCSPFSDTTIVTAISCDIAPDVHVKTQLPFALNTMVIAAFFGFLPAGLGLSPIVIIPLATLIMLLQVKFVEYYRNRQLII